MTTPRVELLLDNPVAIQTVDRSGMLSFAGALGEQLERGFELGRSIQGLTNADPVDSMVVCGMGGSGITGDILRVACSERLPVPIVTSKGYRLPPHCGPNTFVLAVSYSGNTEETLAAYREAVSRGCRVVTIASGGELCSAAMGDGLPTVVLPSDVLAPRAALGLLVGAALGVLGVAFGGGDGDVGTERDIATVRGTLGQLAAGLAAESPSDLNPAKQVAAWLRGATPLVWGTEGVAEAAAVRWKTQLNENAKVPAFWAVLPELDHNEVEAWHDASGENYRIVVLRSRSEPSRVASRLAATLDAMAAAGLESREVWAEGNSVLEEALSLAMTGDFVSVYLAVLRGVDPTPIPILSGLKERRAMLRHDG